MTKEQAEQTLADMGFIKQLEYPNIGISAYLNREKKLAAVNPKHYKDDESSYYLIIEEAFDS